MGTVRRVSVAIECGELTCELCERLKYDNMVNAYGCQLFRVFVFQGKRCPQCLASETDENDPRDGKRA